MLWNMVQGYLDQARALFEIDKSKLNTTIPLEEKLIEFETEYVYAYASQRLYPKEKTYCLHAGIIGNRTFEFGSKEDALNDFFMENQETINKCIARILNREGLYARLGREGIDLGNGRSISTTGTWLIYNTNDYNFSQEEKFKKLMEEEAIIATRSLAAIYGLIEYILQHWPSNRKFDEIFKDQEPVELQESGLVRKYKNKEVTERMNAIRFSAVPHLTEAMSNLKEAAIAEAMMRKNGNNIH